MAVAALVVAIVAVLISAASYLLARRADQRVGRAEHREERDEQRAQREINEGRVRQRGQPVVMPGSFEGGPTATEVTHSYTVRNSGPAPITDLSLWIEDAAGKVVSLRAGGSIALAPDGPSVHLEVAVRQPLPDGELTLVARWVDANGPHTEPTGIHPPKHA